MKKSIGLMLILLLAGSAVHARKKQKNQKNVATEQSVTKDSLGGDYRKIAKDAIISKGLFTTLLGKKTGSLHFELPDSAFAHTYLLANRVAGTSNPQDYVAGQMATSPIMLRFSKDEQRVYIHVVQYRNYVEPDDPITPAFRKNFADPVLKGFKIVARNKENVVIDVTSFFGGNERCISPIKPEDPLSKLLGVGSSVKGTFQADGSGVTEVKTFPRNIEIKSRLAFSSTSTPYTVQVHRSLFVLPDTLMPMRLQDNRVGYFSSGKSLFTSDADRILPRTFIHRWRVEPRPEDRERYFRGELVEPMKPIVFYVDTAFPAKWRGVVKEGIEEWNRAFEAAGFKNVVKALDYPSDNPDFDPDDMRYSCVKYAVTDVANAMGPSYVDPRTGEILTADVIWYHNILSLLHNWRFVQTGAVDARVRKIVFDDDVMQESIRYAASHEIGHTLGLMHNMGASYALPVDSLRSPQFTQTYGTTPSIMDYARNNFIAQPGDFERGVKLTPPSLGVYDIYAINWGYRLIEGTFSPEEERSMLNHWINEKKNDPMYTFGAQQVFSVIDPTDQTEDLGDDHIKAGNLAISNLKIVMSHLEDWNAEPGERFDNIENMYVEVVRQYMRHLSHVAPYIGGVCFNELRQGERGTARSYIDRAGQKRAMLWLLNEARTSADWLTPASLLTKTDRYLNLNDRLQSSVVGCLFDASAYYRISEGGRLNPSTHYTLPAYLDDVIAEVFRTSGSKLTPAERRIQASAVSQMISQSGLNGGGVRNLLFGLSDMDSVMTELGAHEAYPCSCSGGETSFTRFNMSLPSMSKDDVGALMLSRLKRVLQMLKSRRSAATGENRDFYDYQVLLIERALKGKE
ncbi:MAG: zinc-dependent metalloprotease [Clostridium sp.]|nr:zinc-dependent metalloprotease [Clostridium sp.]